jgi:hypothetical protein
MNRTFLTSAMARYPERSQLRCDSADLHRKQVQQSLRYQLDVQPLRTPRQPLLARCERCVRAVERRVLQ